MLGNDKIFSKYVRIKVLCIFLIFSFSKSWGQYSINGTGAGNTYTQNFDAFRGTAVTLPTNWVVSVASYNATYPVLTVGAAAPTVANASGNNCYAGRASSSSADYSIIQKQGTSGSTTITFNALNNTGGTIDGFVISWNVEQISEQGRPTTVDFKYRLNGGAYVTTGLTGTTLYTSSTGASTTFAYANSTPTLYSIVISGISLPASQTADFQFSIANGGSSGSNAHVGIDDFTVYATAPVSCSAPSTTITPTTQTLCAGTSTNITVTHSATSPSYTWQASSTSGGVYSNVVNGTPTGAAYSGTNAAVLTLTAGSTYYYRCLVAEGGTCTATSGTSTLVVNSSPTITSQPINKTICSGSNTSFTVVSSGSPLTYQWQEKVGAGAFTNIANGGVYSGATSATLVLTNPAISLSTNQYQCIVSVASCSSVTTTAAVLTINTTPATPSVPLVPSNPACTTGTFSAVTSTVSGVNWYWQTTSVGVSTSSISTSDYTTASTATVYVRALDATATCWSTLSSSTSVVVNTAPTVTLAPVSKTVCSGANVSFTTSASGTSPTYQWYENQGSGNNVITGATTKTLTLSSVTPSMNSYSYQCVITVLGCSTVSTTAVILTVNTTPAAPPAPSPVSNPACTTGTLSASSSTVAGVTWYWQGTSAAGISTASVSSSSYALSSSGNYYVRALDASGTCWSAASSISVTVNVPDLITAGTNNSSICSETNTSFTVTGLSASTPKKWQVSIDNGTTFNDVVAGPPYNGSLTNSTLSLTNTPVSFNNYQYQCVVSVPGCPVITSTVGILTVTQTPAAPPTPSALANPACSGTSLAAMTSTVAGVTWYWQGTTAAGSSTTSPTSSVYNVPASGTYYVRARADGSSCLSTSSSAVITVNTPPTVVTQPTDKVQCVGTNTTFAISAAGTALTYQWQVNTGSGFGNLSNIAPYSNVTTATLSITGITGGMTGYLYQCIVSGASPCSPATSNSATLTITASGTPSVAASALANSAIGCNAFNLSWANGSGSNRLVVVSASPVVGSPVDGTIYAASATFGSGGTIAAGEFVVYKGTNNSVFITGLSATTTYYYKVFEFNGCSLNYLTSGTIPNGNVITNSCSVLPGVTGVYVDACSGGCGYEGNNELVWGVSGSYGMLVSNNGPTLHYNGTSPPTTTYISTYGQYAANISALNAAVGGTCGTTTFVDPNTQGFIPPNSKFLIAHSCLCSPAAYDFSNLCGSGPIYVVFGNDAVWPCNGTGGIFGNSGASIRYFDLDLSSWGVALDPIYDFVPNSLVGGDGAYVLFSPPGGTAITYSNSGVGCVVPMTILPIELVDFYATQNGSKNDLIWKVTSEKNVSQYIIEKSDDGINFIEMSRVNSLNNEGSNVNYTTEDVMPNSGITYYRLSTIENNGKLNHDKIIYLDRNNKDWKAIFYQQDNFLYLEFKNSIPKNSTLSLFDLTGKLMASESIIDLQTIINTQNFTEGIYFLRISAPYQTENFKIIIYK